ncbi:MAG: hypothetical protein Q9159_003386 [Coniocarpon cinnabarinum]
MDTEPDAFVNRDDPIPILKIDKPDPEGQSSPHRAHRSPSPQRSKHVAQKEASTSMHDRIFATMFEQIFPIPSDKQEPPKPDRRSRKYLDRPNFSVGRMSKNFRTFNARHPPPPGATPNDAFSIRGPATAVPRGVKPAPEMSKDFFRNMRDLQNSMEDFSLIHDRLVSFIGPLTNFADESLSSLVFLIFFFTSCLLFLFSSLVPWRAAFLAGGWGLIGSLHPITGRLLASLKHEELRARSISAGKQSWSWARQDIVMDEAPEIREVEAFELQRHRPGTEWEPWLYSTLPYTPLSPRRVAGERPQGVRFFEDVQAPQGWEWRDKKWTLDLSSKEWVEERMITAVEIETEGERWVYDISASDSSGDDPGYQQGMQDREETTTMGAKGEWRRRRWVRLVQRKLVE